MPQPQQSSSAVRQALTSLIKTLTQLDVAGWLTTVKDILQAIIPAKPKLEGMYEVLEHESRLELLDSKGKRATYHKRQRVRFLQDNIIAFQDKAWGGWRDLRRLSVLARRGSGPLPRGASLAHPDFAAGDQEPRQR